MTNIKTNVSYTAMIGATAVLALAVLFTALPVSASTLSDISGRDFGTGMRGTDVAALQGVLSEQGYLNVPIGVPYGYFGSLTQSAVMRFQSFLGVTADGKFGPNTRARMNEVFSARGWLTLLASN